MTNTTVTVTRLDTGKVAVTLTGELVGEETVDGLVRVTVRNGDDEQYVQYDPDNFSHEVDNGTAA